MFPDHNALTMQPPEKLPAIEQDTERLGFDMPSVRETGALLRHLAATGPNLRILELGTGTGLATCWLLDGMAPSSQITTVDNDEAVLAVAERHLGSDARLTILKEDAAVYLERSHPATFDLIFADAWPGKFSHLDQSIALLSEAGIYAVDDLLPQPNWPEGHAPRVPVFIDNLRARSELTVEFREWSSGLLLASRCRDSST